MKRVQIGWLSEDLPDEDTLEEYVEGECRSDFGPDVLSLAEGSRDAVVYHSHRDGVGSRFLPVFVEWEPTDVQADSECGRPDCDHPRCANSIACPLNIEEANR